MDPGTSLLNSFYSLLNKELPEELSYSGPFYHHHLTEELRPRRSFAKFLAEHVNLAFEKGSLVRIYRYIFFNVYDVLPCNKLWECVLG
jgi:hypothetical protein